MSTDATVVGVRPRIPQVAEAAMNLLPPDLDARLTEARTKAELALQDGKVGRPRSTRDRQRLIDVRILPEVIAYGSCLCEAARRRRLPVSEIEHLVVGYLPVVAAKVWARLDLLDAFVREAVERVKDSPEWEAHLMERQSVAEQLATGDSASTEVERGEVTPATSAAGAIDVSQTEQPIAPLLTPDPGTAPTVDTPTMPSISEIGPKRPPETIDTARSAALEARKERRRRWITEHSDAHRLDRVGFLQLWGFSNTALYAIINDSPGRVGPKARKQLLKMLGKSPEEWDRL